jgi:hypothetical protein
MGRVGPWEADQQRRRDSRIATDRLDSDVPLPPTVRDTAAPPEPGTDNAKPPARRGLPFKCSVNFAVEDGLEIRLRRDRDVGVGFVILFDVFCADDFRPVV